MANPIVPKKSSTAGAVPTSGQLLTGEIAANTADGKLFIKKADGTVVQVSGAASDPAVSARRFAWASPYSYSGRAATGSATSAAVWTIKRSQISAGGAIASTLTATNCAWDNFDAATYS